MKPNVLILPNNYKRMNKTTDLSSIWMKVALNRMITDLMPMHPKVKNFFDTHNWQLKNMTNAIGAIHNGQLFSVGLYDCSINSNIFHHWVKTLLLSELPQNSVIVMDNATFHKRQNIQSLIEDAGHTILWLPPYSSDLNLIEKTWAWVKQKRKDWWLGCIDSLFFYFMWICTIC
ncbi:transposase [Moraxella catarrhalis]|nr:transposase [Moraxella catarrhalis]RKL85741.1 transposase [Moraxella catarrhalis]RKL86937.1 transposase [Moraxella catarrhalis]RKL96657.1 transposase [Moraxella catarrhalis]